MFELTRKQVVGGFVALLLVVGIASIGKFIEWVDTDKTVVCQHLSGKLSYWTEPGPKYQGWGDVIAYDKTSQLWFSDSEGEGGEKDYDLGIPIIFNDAGNGKINGSLRVVLPIGDDKLYKIRTSFPSMKSLMYDLVRPAVVKVVYASGTLMSSFESYAEKKTDLIFYINDQLENGVYKTKIIEVVTQDELDPTKTKTVRVASLIENPNAPGGYERQEKSPLTEYGITADNLSISSITYEEKILNQIADQQKARMNLLTAQAQAAEAKQQAIKAEEQGKANAMTAKWEQEKLKAVEVTRAQQEFEVAQFEAKKAKEVAEKIIQEGRAEAEANRAKVSAGLTPQEKAEWEFKTKVGVAQAISEIKLPSIIMGGGQGQSGNQALDIMSLKFATDLVDKLSSEKK
ncbi:MAG: SPFH domain-containing protein [Candidatus Absconditabacteria bacterium]|nr:SPFH domain-containing protein [Candidatus Absconditabacteria bacterium]MDD3868169.1 SPFH domain-containing protein [Candidatus Absconditabacteria bacterium]MDD4714555.1 SPFH domain-containing protein [Candidatus Absconditabacteria bacterium]